MKTATLRYLKYYILPLSIICSKPIIYIAEITDCYFTLKTKTSG